MPRAKNRTPHLFDRWKQISELIRAADDIWLFLDFDGTLVPICPTPKDVKLPERVRKVLRKLSRHPRVHVAMVSGRRNAALRKYVRVPHIQLLGLYGWERNGGIDLPARTRAALPRLRAILKLLPQEFPGIRIEDKGVSFGIHFRGASTRSVQRAQDWTRKFLTSNRADFRVIHGNRAWEIVPRHVMGKGAALRAIMKELQSPFLPIYLGDDMTDEPAFQVLHRGIPIRVGRAFPTHALFRLRNPEEVRMFLERMDKELR